MASSGSAARIIGKELASHAPFTIVGALGGIAIMVLIVSLEMPQPWSERLFEGFHSAHVLLSALATAGMYRIYGGGRLWATIAIGYFGSVGIATLSDCLIPYVGESLLGMEGAEIHAGFIEEWWLVNPLAMVGIAAAYFWPRTRFPHFGHVLLSTGASLFHVAMTLGGQLGIVIWIVVFVFLFLSVWLPCCVSDIVFPLLFSKGRIEADKPHRDHC